MKPARILAVLAFAVVPAAAQPFIYYRGIVNAASTLPPDHPSGSIARGAIFTITGRNLGPADGTLDDLSIDVSQGTLSLAAIPLASSASNVSAIMPPDAPLGKVSVRVTYNGQRSNASGVNVVRAGVGLYAANGLGFGPALAQNMADDGTATPNTALAPAQPGQTVALSATGFGGAANTPLEVFVAGESATLVSAGASDCCAGQDQIVFQVPDDALLGCYVPVQVRTMAAVVSNAVTIAISSDGSPCGDPSNPISAVLQAGGNVGVVLPQRIVARANSMPPADVTSDWMFAALQPVVPGATYFNLFVSLPPLGACTVAGSSIIGDRVDLVVPTATELDAGSAMSVAGPAGKVSVGAMPIFSGLLGSSPDLPGAPPLFYTGSGPYTFSLPGGGQVGAVSASFSLPQPLLWTNRDQVGTVDRRNPLAVTWTGADSTNDIVLILGMSQDIPHNAAGAFLCAASAADGTFTVPQYILAGLPATVADPSVSAAGIAVGAAAYLNPTSFSGSGLDSGFIIPSVFSLKTVVMQ
jgi:uncharacterized protein (TIGR03437 family)